MKMLLLVLPALLLPLVSGQLRSMCFYTNWSQYRAGAGRFVPADIDPSLCTNILYAFASMEGNSLIPVEWNDEAMYQAVLAHKVTEPDLRVSLSVGGWNFELARMTLMLSTPANRAEFIANSIEFLRSRGFDGLDLAFLYPGNRGSPPEDKFRYTELVQTVGILAHDWVANGKPGFGLSNLRTEMSQAFDDEATSTGQERLLLTASVGVNEEVVDTAYEVPNVTAALDYVNLMAYDLQGSWNSYTGHNAPLFPRDEEEGDERKLNVEFSANNWVSLGADPAKLLVGMTTYGRGFTLADPADSDFGASALGPSTQGGFTFEPGFMSYYETCVLGEEPGAEHFWHDEHQVPWLVAGDQWMGYDSQESLTNKTVWLKDQGFGGYMVWALDLDDFTGQFCSQGPYPLLRALHSELRKPETNRKTIL